MIEKEETSKIITQKISNDHGYSSFENEDVHDDQDTGISSLTAALILVNTAFGIGILNYPKLFDELGGIYVAIILQIMVLILLSITMYYLAYCAELSQAKTYHEVVLRMCGPIWEWLLALVVTVVCFAVGVSYLVIIGDQFDRIFATFIGHHFCNVWYLNRKLTITMVAVLAIWPISFFKSLEFLKISNYLAIFSNGYVIFLSVYEFYTLGFEPGEMKTHPDNLVVTLTGLATISLAHQSHECLVPTYACLKNRSPRKFITVIIMTMAILFIFHSMVGIYGYRTFGNKITSDVMKMYDPSDVVVILGVGALIVRTITVYPQLFICGRQSFIGLFEGHYGKVIQNNEQVIRIISTIFWNLIILVVSLVTPNISVAIEFMGVLTVCTAFIFPALCMVSLSNDHEHKSNFLKCIGIAFILMGIFMFFVIFDRALNGLNNLSENENLCK